MKFNLDLKEYILVEFYYKVQQFKYKLQEYINLTMIRQV